MSFKSWIIFAINLLLLTTLTLTGCSTVNDDPTLAFQGQAEDRIYNDGEMLLAKGSYNDAIKHFEALDALYPFGATARQAQFDSIYAYYMTGDAATTLAAADRFIHLYPRDPHVDYAYYMKGLANFNLHQDFVTRLFRLDMAERDIANAKKAYQDFADLTHYFPDSQYALDARQHMIFLRNILANHDLQVAQFYMKRHAYVAAANRANDLVKQYPQAMAVADALKIMVNAYRALHLEQAANEAQRVLRLNYPNKKQ